MKTASYFTYDGPGRIAISRSWPRNTPKGFRGFRALAPGKWFHSVDVDEYSRRYAAEVLAPLDPQKTWDALHELAGGAEPVLLCFEHPDDGRGVVGEDGLFCHRAIVSRWIEETLGHRVPELGFEDQGGHPLDPPTIHLPPLARTSPRAFRLEPQPARAAGRR